MMKTARVQIDKQGHNARKERDYLPAQARMWLWLRKFTLTSPTPHQVNENLEAVWKLVLPPDRQKFGRDHALELQQLMQEAKQIARGLVQQGPLYDQSGDPFVEKCRRSVIKCAAKFVRAEHPSPLTPPSFPSHPPTHKCRKCGKTGTCARTLDRSLALRMATHRCSDGIKKFCRTGDLMTGLAQQFDKNCAATIKAGQEDDSRAGEGKTDKCGICGNPKKKGHTCPLWTDWAYIQGMHDAKALLDEAKQEFMLETEKLLKEREEKLLATPPSPLLSPSFPPPFPDMTITTMTWGKDDAPRLLPPNQRNTLWWQMQNQQNEQRVNPDVIKAGRQAMEVCLPAARTPCHVRVSHLLQTAGRS